ncbi:PREDICTED: ubiquitin-like-specific protease 1 isoform X2 [Nelumbo nucifera]|uniref:Ubiquitin-like-specific protease 1 isoform X2 n=1 Tax=Nelumbo nucifera TaxID=4432 RepID=A0A1U8B704_NELNU|nr:PREDICTED: ubiquitin-like-specific protease 1 isoform X2 [Nelumbo nucifera]
MTREKEDISWKHCTAVLYGNRGKHESVLKCNYCGATYVAYGGVHRIKRHLAKMGKNAKHCPNVPPEVADLIKRDLAENAQKKRQQQSTGSEHIQITDNYNSTKNQRKDGRKKEQFEIQDRTEELLKCQPTQSVQGAKEGSQFQGASSDVAMMDEEIPPSNTVMEVEAHPEPEQETIDGILKRLRNIEAQLQQLQHLQALESKVQKLKQLISTQLMEYKSEMLQGFTSLSLQIQRSSAMPEANMAHTQEANNFQTNVLFPHASDFPSFTELEKKAIVYALFNPNGPFDENLVILWTSHLTRSELLCMRDGNWVSSAVMNCVMDVLVHEQLANGLVKRHYFPSYFAEKILKDEPPSLEELKAFYQSLLKYDLLQCELLFIPLCVDSHWFVYVINLRDKRVEVLNSLPMDGFTIELKYLLRMKETCNDILSSLSGRPMAITEWPVLLPELPIQKSDCDCGIFVICYMEYWDGRLMKSFAQDDIPYFRMKVLADLLLHPENKVVIRDG